MSQTLNLLSLRIICRSKGRPREISNEKNLKTVSAASLGPGRNSKGFRLFTTGPVVAAQLRGMRPALTTTKDTVMLGKNSNTNTINQTFNYALVD